MDAMNAAKSAQLLLNQAMVHSDTALVLSVVVISRNQVTAVCTVCSIVHLLLTLCALGYGSSVLNAVMFFYSYFFKINYY